MGELERGRPRARGGDELARSLFSRIDASGFQATRFHLTAEATAHGFAYAVPAIITGIVGYGRGERSRGYAFELIYSVEPAAGRIVEVA